MSERERERKEKHIKKIKSGGGLGKEVAYKTHPIQNEPKSVLNEDSEGRGDPEFNGDRIRFLKSFYICFSRF